MGRLTDNWRAWLEQRLRSWGLEVRPYGVSGFPDVTPKELALINKYRPYTMTTELRQWTLLKAVKYLDEIGVPGDIVECGVWRGGNLMLVKDYRGEAAQARRLFLYDTFAGMSEPSAADIKNDGTVALETFRVRQKPDYNAWCYASLEDVAESFKELGLSGADVVFVKGMVEQTLRGPHVPDQIALLRLDTDWYESTRVELEVLYPRLSRGGVLIIDDFGTWQGAQKATDEYFQDRPILLLPVERGCRIAIKP
jgi:O-methyltransferase